MRTAADLRAELLRWEQRAKRRRTLQVLRGLSIGPLCVGTLNLGIARPWYVGGALLATGLALQVAALIVSRRPLPPDAGTGAEA